MAMMSPTIAIVGRWDGRSAMLARLIKIMVTQKPVIIVSRFSLLTNMNTASTLAAIAIILSPRVPCFGSCGEGDDVASCCTVSTGPRQDLQRAAHVPRIKYASVRCCWQPPANLMAVAYPRGDR